MSLTKCLNLPFPVVENLSRFVSTFEKLLFIFYHTNLFKLKFIANIYHKLRRMKKNFEKPNLTFKFNSKSNSLTLLIYICLIMIKDNYY